MKKRLPGYIKTIGPTEDEVKAMLEGLLEKKLMFYQMKMMSESHNQKKDHLTICKQKAYEKNLPTQEKKKITKAWFFKPESKNPSKSPKGRALKINRLKVYF